MYLSLEAKHLCLHPAKCIQPKRHELLLTNTLRAVWRQRRNPTGSCLLCLAPPPLCLPTSCAYSLHALLVCLSFFLKASFLLLSWVDDFCKDCNIWQGLLPMVSSASIFSVFSFLKDTVCSLVGIPPNPPTAPFPPCIPTSLILLSFSVLLISFRSKANDSQSNYCILIYCSSLLR